MKTLVLYATTYGLTAEMAKQLSQKIKGDVDCINLMTQDNIDLESYENIVIGGSIYMGQVQKKLKQFCLSHENELINHNLNLFLCCGLEENFETQLNNAFSSKLIEVSKEKVYFGGALNIDKMKFIHKTITKMMVKSSEKEGRALPKPQYDNIDYLANSINNTIN